jgi:hypothetical protein
MEKRQRNLLIAFAVVLLVLLPLFSWMLAAMIGG